MKIFKNISISNEKMLETDISTDKISTGINKENILKIIFNGYNRRIQF